MRTFVFLNARAGSTFIISLLNGQIVCNDAGMAVTDPSEDTRYPNWLWTTPKALHYNPSCGRGTLLQDYILKTEIVSQPEVYSIYAGIDWTNKFFDQLPGPKDLWKFIYIFRDPRNKTASTISWGKEKSDEQKLQEGIQSFKMQAKSLKSMIQDPRFRIFKFEELAKDPLVQFKFMMSFAGLKINEQKYRSIIDQWNQVSNSSFSDKGKEVNKRWHGWSKSWKEQFLTETGQELTDLGFDLNGED